MSSYKTCAVPSCKSTSIKTPDKLFIHVPKDQKRKKWLQLARRDPACISNKSTIYFCEDHFDLPSDMENYTEYRIMGSVKHVRMKTNCLPSYFQCQPDRIKKTTTTVPHSAAAKREHVGVLQDEEIKKTSTSSITLNSVYNDLQSNNQMSKCTRMSVKDKSVQACPVFDNKSFQISMTPQYRSKCTQTSWLVKEKITYTPQFHIGVKPSTSGITDTKKQLNFNDEKFEELLFSASISPYKLSPQHKFIPSSIESLQSISGEQENQSLNDYKSETSDTSRKEYLHQTLLQNMLRLIKNKPNHYIGIPKKCYFLIDVIKGHTKLPEPHILLCLKKIRLNTTFSELADEFGTSSSHASKIFSETVPLMAGILHSFIIKSNKTITKQNLPIAFRHKYHAIQCMVDFLEIEIQKPSKIMHQALTWSKHKKTYTMKYLISSTLDGMINYISPGYSGVISDVLLMEKCDFLNHLEPGVSILSDREFQHNESIFLQKGLNLVRPQTVSFNSKSKQNAYMTKHILNIRLHIKRVIRRLRKFSMFKRHSVINMTLLQSLDECVVIACALINLGNCININK